MEIEGFIWLEEVVEKLARKHRVGEAEVTEVFSGSPRFRFVEQGHRRGEDVYAALGKTHAGRCLIVFFVHRKDGRAVILTARDMTRAERKRYEKK